MTTHHRPTRPSHKRPHGLLRPLVMGAALALLAAVFAAYLSPHLVADLANRVWACF